MKHVEQQEVMEEIKRLLKEKRIGILSTVRGDEPSTRYMIFRNEDLLLHTISSRKSQKVQDILINQKVHILLGVDNGCYGKPYLDITASATIHDEQEWKEHFWHDNFLKYLEGPDDPNYIVIRCEPKTIRLMNHPELDGPYTITFN